MSETITPLVSFIAILAGTLLWFGLPLIPTIREIRKRTEANPLPVDNANDGEVRHFARRFIAYLESNFQAPTLKERMERGAAWEGAFSDKTPYQIVEKDGNAFLRLAKTVASIPALAIFSGAISLPDRLKFPFGIYAAEDLQTGSNAVVRSIYGRGNVQVKDGSSVLRWIHAEGDLGIGRDCALYGRASADRTMQIGADVEFERLHAQRLEFGHTTTPIIPPAASQLLPPLMPPSKPMSEDCFSIATDLDVPPQTMMYGNFVVRGNIRIGSNARIEGSLKSHGTFRIEPGATVVGSVISGGDMTIGANCRVSGPVVASRRLRIEEGCQIGFEGHLTSAIAPSIVIEPGALIFGTVWARENGYVEERHGG